MTALHLFEGRTNHSEVQRMSGGKQNRFG